jgi:hypothetical protein
MLVSHCQLSGESFRKSVSQLSLFKAEHMGFFTCQNLSILELTLVFIFTVICFMLCRLYLGRRLILRQAYFMLCNLLLVVFIDILVVFSFFHICKINMYVYLELNFLWRDNSLNLNWKFQNFISFLNDQGICNDQTKILNVRYWAASEIKQSLKIFVM